MIERNCALVINLERVLIRECALYKEYLRLLAEERSWLKKFRIANVEESTAKRAGLVDALLQIQEERLALMKQFPLDERKDMRLSERIKQHCHESDKMRLLPYIELLRELVIQSRSENLQFSMVTKYVTSLVNGSLSIIRSASHNITKSYGRKGKIEKQYHPNGGRSSSILKEV